MGHLAGIAQLVEHDLAKVGVEGPSPFSRSKMKKTSEWMSFLFYIWMRSWSRRPLGVGGAPTSASWAKPVEDEGELGATQEPRALVVSNQPSKARELIANSPFSRRLLP